MSQEKQSGNFRWGILSSGSSLNVQTWGVSRVVILYNAWVATQNSCFPTPGFLSGTPKSVHKWKWLKPQLYWLEESADRVQGWKKTRTFREESLKETCHRGGEFQNLHIRSTQIFGFSKVCIFRGDSMGIREVEKQQLEAEETEWKFQLLLFKGEMNFGNWFQST